MAARTGQSVSAVLDTPYGITLWTFVQLKDADRIERTIRQREAVEFASLITLAVWKPEQLAQVEQRLLRKVDEDTNELRDRERALADYVRTVRQRQNPIAKPQDDAHGPT